MNRPTMLCCVVMLSLLAGAQALAAAKTYDDKDLAGTYHYVNAETRVQGEEIEHCSAYGTIEFDGAGRAAMTMELRKCVRYPSGTLEVVEGDFGEFEYEVFPNGEVLIVELHETSGDPTDNVTHARLVDNGRLMLIDGTRGCEPGPPPTCPHPDFLQSIGTAARE